jgi:predicted SAM-dependent methyltransferase
MEWSDVLDRDPIILNLGGAEFCHPHPDYQRYISVDLAPRPDGWSVGHDLTRPLPLPDGSVHRIHTEDFLEHIPVDAIESLLAECYRVLAPGTTMRIGVPDYMNPKDRWCLDRGDDPRYPGHVTLTHRGVMEPIFDRSPFPRYTFYHYWEGNRFVAHPIDYSLGLIQRTPDNHPRCRRNGPVDYIKTAVRDFFYALPRGFKVPDHILQTRKNHRLYVTSLTADLFRD